MKNEKKEDLQRVVTPEGRVSFPHIFKPSAMPGATPKYSLTLLFKKSQDLSSIKRAIRQAKIEKFGADEKKWPKHLESPVADGDDHPEYDGYVGCWAIKASTSAEYKPAIVDEHVEEILDPSQFYAGCYARAQIYARVWEFGNKMGVHFILDMVQKTGDGKPFGGRKAVKDVFSPIDTGSGSEDENNAEDNVDEASGF